ncbi:MAG: hypothetical protein COW59_09655 [Lysobacterales bacterium CG17_big_fil_post_rev_8_21_14_2_50_64_11]|nr:MAG: hypothetical protein COW59_09655 [Xanthomonadales bacterium CG17_big_fil_post_rev_8_21_14_2_50_64_11]
MHRTASTAQTSQPSEQKENVMFNKTKLSKSHVTGEQMRKLLELGMKAGNLLDVDEPLLVLPPKRPNKMLRLRDHRIPVKHT